MTEDSIWQFAGAKASPNIPLYIAVGGNTGSGKSTLLKEVAAIFSDQYSAAFVHVDERNFHHPLLTSMFFDPKRYALNIQLNFLLQRCTYILRALEMRQPSVFERSHFEDQIFIADHLAEGNICETQYNAYQIVKQSLWSKLPAPDIYVRVLVEPSVSIRRIRSDEREGKRTEEFPSDQIFSDYVHRWYAAYEKFFQEIDAGNLSGAFQNTYVYDVDTSLTPNRSATDLLEGFLNFKEGLRRV